MKPHLLAQQALVRMLFDPELAARVRSDPAAALPELPSTLRAQLAAIDPRALLHDRLRGRRTLRTLFDEYKGSTTLLLSRRRRLAALDQFFASAEFARATARTPLALAFADFLVATEPSLAGVVAIERALAEARRARLPAADQRVHRAPGVVPIATTAGALAALQAAERYLFEVGLMPAVALCADAPTLTLDAAADDPTPLYLVTVPTETGHSLVTIDAPTHALVASLPRRFTLELQPLIDDDVAVRR